MAAAENLKIKYSVSLTFIGIFFAFIAVSIGLLNTYPTISSRDSVFAAKQGALSGQATIMSVSLSALERLSADGVVQVMALIDVGDFDRVIVTGPDAEVLYDTDGVQDTRGSVSALPQVAAALGGALEFDCRYTGSAFLSDVAAPVLSYGEVIGSVYIHEEDNDQAAMIHSIQGRLRNISIVAGVVTLVVIIFFTRFLTRRLRELVEAMHIVREGNYEYRVEIRGGDEVAALGEAFNDMTRRLQSTEELRRRFVSDASHELRTPLASIRLLSDSIVQSGNMDTETMREFVTDIGTEAERLQRMTEKLMRLTRMDANVAAEKTAVPLRKTVERTVHLLEPLAQQKGVTLYMEKGESVSIEAAEDDIFQIVFNLTENAIKYNSFGGNVFLWVEAEGDEAVLTVEDTGIGIPAEDVPHIFSRFYRVDKARSREAGGSGLGLSIVHDAVLANGGTIAVERRETVGTRFIVRFPLYSEEKEAEI
ncbi:MAG: HAMP domain-containing histidine kinase [Oscillospiraceae bacterium]|nr:HAMP domain-containing histidine kinase [Oscillospiraceae bacterium]